MIKEIRFSGMLDRGPDNPRNSEGSFLKLNDGRTALRVSDEQLTWLDDKLKKFGILQMNLRLIINNYN